MCLRLSRARSIRASLLFVPLVAACVEAEPSGPPPVEPGDDLVAATAAARAAACAADPRVLVGAVSAQVCVGADLFFREPFGGNGRSCASCHRVDNNFTIDAAYIAKLPPEDPLFVAELEPALAGLELPEQMRGRGLILENPDGFAPDPTVNFVLRAVPHNLSMGVSVARPPNAPADSPAERTGWSGDGAPGAGALRDFQTGATIQHYTRSLARVAGEDYRLPTAEELDAIAEFMRQLGRTNELDLAMVTMSDARAEAGRGVFLTAGRCNACHGNAGANATFAGGGNRNFNTGVEDSRNPALAGFPRDGGFLHAPNPAGGFGDGTFNTPPLVEAADTGPFFHTDTTVSGASAHDAATATTIEEAIAFYDTPAFNASPAVARTGPIDLTAGQIDDLGRFLRGVNAAFNAQMAGKRVAAARAVALAFPGRHVDLQRELLRLAGVEVADALADLLGQPALNLESRRALVRARALIDGARGERSTPARVAALHAALAALERARAALGTNLAFTIGDGTVMF